MAKKKEKKIREFRVKVPVYATEIKEGTFGYNDMITRLKKELDTYNNNSDIERVSFNKSNKTQRKVIKKVDCFDYNIENMPILLLKTTTFNTNIHDGFTEEMGSTTQIFSNGTKLGSEHNYMLFYPNLVGLEPNQKGNWLIFVCGNSNKYDNEIIETAKLVIGRVLNLGFIHITPQDILDKIQTSVSKLKIKYIGIEKDISDIEEKFPSFLIESSLKREKTKTYKDISFSDAKELLRDDSINPHKYQIREVSFDQGKKGFKIIRKFLGFRESETEFDGLDNLIEEAQQLFQETAEQTFTDDFIVSETEDKNKCLHDHEFIIEKITPIILNYIASYNV
jgi:hypothetical protein